MSSFILIIICLVAGILFRLSGKLPADAHKGINAWIIYLALPAASFKYLPHIIWNSDLVFPLLSPLIVWAGGWVYSTMLTSSYKLSQETSGSLKLTTGLANTSFVGFPLITAWFGVAELGTGVICDQVTFFLLSTAGLIVAMNSSAHHVLQPIALFKKLLTFPPFIGCLAAITLPRIINIAAMDPVFNSLAATLAPLALFSIGLQLRWDGIAAFKKLVPLALFYRLILCPALLSLIALLFQLDGRVTQVTVFEAAMPTLLSSGIVAEQYKVNPALANMVISAGIVISLVTTAIWYYIITAVL